jgi:hypothetical protein
MAQHVTAAQVAHADAQLGAEDSGFLYAQLSQDGFLDFQRLGPSPERFS